MYALTLQKRKRAFKLSQPFIDLNLEFISMVSLLFSLHLQDTE